MLSRFGSILSVSNISPKNAHGWGFNLKEGSFLSKIIDFLGVAHTSSRLRNRIVSKIIKSKKEIKSILDIGSGIGLTGFYLNQFGYSYVGIDKSKYKIDMAKRLAESVVAKNIKFINSDVLKNRELKQEFDCLICMEVLEHAHDPGKILNQIYKFTRRGGFVILSFPSTHFINSLAKKYFSHVRVGLEPNDIKKLVKPSTLKIENVYSFGNTILAKIFYVIDFYLIKYAPLLAGAHFFFFYPLAILDQEHFKSKSPLGYIIVLKK